MSPNSFDKMMDPMLSAEIGSNHEMQGHVLVEDDEEEEDKCSLHSDDSSTSAGGASQVSTQTADQASLLAAKESEQVCWLRGFLFVLMLLATFLLALSIFYSTRNNEKEQFEVQYADHASKIFDAFHMHLKDSMVASDNLAAALTMHGKSSAAVAAAANANSTAATTWPFIDLPDFHIHASRALHVAATNFIGYAPLVNQSLRKDYEDFSVLNQEWIDVGLAYENQETTTVGRQAISEQIYRLDDETGTDIVVIGDDDTGPFFPIWQHAPIAEESVNFNLISHPELAAESQVSISSESIVLGLISDPKHGNQIVGESDDPFSHFYYPIFSEFKSTADREIVALLVSTVDWTNYFRDVELPPSANGIQCILTNGCGQAYTYEVQGDTVYFVREGDGHDSRYDYLEVSLDVWETLQSGNEFLMFENLEFNRDYCDSFSLHIFPSEATEQSYYTNRPGLYTFVVVAVFLFTSLAFVLYDYIVERRQKMVLKTAVQNHRIVASLFPATVRNRLFGEGSSDQQGATSASAGKSGTRPVSKKKSFIDNTVDTDPSSGRGVDDKLMAVGGSNPIADLFKETTVLFADVAGFTAWSSVREPGDVFVLLETLYAAMDKIASRRKVFKIETIGDCYLAVTGIPIPQENHAIIMIRFAQDCLQKTDEVTRELATQLGPDTTDLDLRIGLHSGPVTAGVLRGQKSRFQLFGDTVNTASRMESTGKARFIQLSQATADLAIAAGKGAWIEPREDLVFAKGIGNVRTYFVTQQSTSTSTNSVRSSSDNDSVLANNIQAVCDREDGVERLADTCLKDQTSMCDALDEKTQRFVGWNNELLSRLLKDVMARRMASQSCRPIYKKSASFLNRGVTSLNNPREEYSKVIVLPRSDPPSVKSIDPDSIELDGIVQKQLLDLVTRIAKGYRQNPFHNFEHATHVTTSVSKIVNRMAAAHGCDANGAKTEDKIHSNVDDFTYGLTADPMTHVALVFSSLIHDLDHPGVTNGQLVTEHDARAERYLNKSVAEQHAIDIGWELFMDKSYTELRGCLFETEDDMERFRRITINSIIATDIFDQDLKLMRNDRWDEAFPNMDKLSSEHMPVGSEGMQDLKATIVIEHIIQAADVAHTMQHWQVYQKWNQHLFEEMYLAYKEGRLPNDPSIGWFAGELWFFDNYIIPLAYKLKKCQAFGVSSDDFLKYAQHNRKQWEMKGEELVKEMHKKLLNGGE